MTVKKLSATTLLLALSFCQIQTALFAYPMGNGEVEHLQVDKHAKINLVKVTPSGNIIQKDNYLIVNFAQNFNSKYYKDGDYVQFNFENDLRTQEGTLIIPCNSSLIARICLIEPPKWFSRNAEVYLEFTNIVLPDSTTIPVALNFAGKKKHLQKGAGATAGKIAAYTLTIGGTGAGLGAAIGAAAGHTVTGVIIGGSIGGGIGLISGIVSPGLHYKAKQGDKLILEVQDNLKIPCQ